MVFEDGVCYWDVTSIVNNWILYNQSNGNEGLENLGIAITGREDVGAEDPDDREHVKFFSKYSAYQSSTVPHAVVPSLLIIDEKHCFDEPWIPDWSQHQGYTVQQWLLSASQGRCEQGMVPDGYCDNQFGEPNIIWDEEDELFGSEVINPFLTWHPLADGEDPNGQPDWVDGVYGGVYRGSEYNSFYFDCYRAYRNRAGNIKKCLCNMTGMTEVLWILKSKTVMTLLRQRFEAMKLDTVTNTDGTGVPGCLSFQQIRDMCK